MRMKKRILCQGEAKTLKNGRKRMKNGYCVNLPLDRNRIRKHLRVVLASCTK